MRKPHEVNVRVDTTTVPLANYSRAITNDIITAYVVIKGFKTLCSAIEHVVVTKVK